MRRLIRWLFATGLTCALLLWAIPIDLHGAANTTSRTGDIVCPPLPTRGREPQPRPPCREVERNVRSSRIPAAICLRLAIDRTATTQTDNIVQYVLSATNNGRGTASRVEAIVPFDPLNQELVNASFSASDGRVRSAAPDQATLELGRIDRAETLTATLSVRWLTPPTAAYEGFTRTEFAWTDARDGGRGITNRASLWPKINVGMDTLPRLAVHSGPNDMVTISYDGFTSQEHVGLWMHTSMQTDATLGEGRADNQGHIFWLLKKANLTQAGFFVAKGQCSQLTVLSEGIR